MAAPTGLRLRPWHRHAAQVYPQPHRRRADSEMACHASDADLSTLRLQLASADLLTYEERLLTFPFDTAVPLATFSCAGFWQPVIDFMQPEIEQTAQV
jgi:hypothetical protein